MGLFSPWHSVSSRFAGICEISDSRLGLSSALGLRGGAKNCVAKTAYGKMLGRGSDWISYLKHIRNGKRNIRSLCSQCSLETFAREQRKNMVLVLYERVQETKWGRVFCGERNDSILLEAGFFYHGRRVRGISGHMADCEGRKMHRDFSWENLKEIGRWKTVGGNNTGSLWHQCTEHGSFNLLKPTGHVMYQQFNIQQL